MKKIVLGNLKGGVGKTITAVNLGYSFASVLGKRVLMVDMDPQANLTSFFTKVTQNGRTVRDVLQKQTVGEKAIYRSKYRNIDIIKGDVSLKEDDVAEGALEDTFQRVRRRYDICIIDTRPAFEKLTCTAVSAADILLTPIYLDNFCRDNLAMVEMELQAFPYDVDWKVFANRVNVYRKAQRNMYKDLLMCQDYPILETCVSESAAIGNALDLYKPVLRHRSKAVVAQDYIELAKEIMKNTKE